MDARRGPGRKPAQTLGRPRDGDVDGRRHGTRFRQSQTQAGVEAMNRLVNARRILATLLLALWWSGFTFYAGRVVFIGHHVLRSKIRQGFITERVTTELNWLGLAALIFVGWEFFASRKTIHRRSAWVIWAVTLLAALALFAL